MSRRNEKKEPIWPKFLIANITLLILGGAGYFGYQYYELDKLQKIDDSYIDKSFIDLVNILSDPDSCTASLEGKNAVSDFSLTKFQYSGSDIYPLKLALSNSSILMNAYSLESPATDVKNNMGTLNIEYYNPQRDEEHSKYKRTVNLYVETDKQDNITFCHALSSSLETTPGAIVKPLRLRVVHVRTQGIQAENNGVRTSIATASCPKGFLLTGCSGSAVGCEALGEAIKKAEPDPMSPNTCEVRADATPACPIIAKAVAICSRVIN